MCCNINEQRYAAGAGFIWYLRHIFSSVGKISMLTNHRIRRRIYNDERHTFHDAT